MSDARALGVLQRVFGYESFRGDQQAIVEQVIDGGDALVLMPTGGGKSLCYQIPSLVREGTGIVVSPLIALMQDQVDALTELGVRAAFLNSTQEWRVARDVEQVFNRDGNAIQRGQRLARFATRVGRRRLLQGLLMIDVGEDLRAFRLRVFTAR